MQDTFKDKVVVVTGGTAGNGRAIAEAFANAGAHVAVVARDPARVARTERELAEHGVRAKGYVGDVADAARVDEIASAVERDLGPIDIWVNNAMTAVFAPVIETFPEEFERVTRVTYLGMVNGTCAALARMQSRDRGVIVQVGSALAYRGIPLQASYCAAKHAIKGFQDALRTELLHDGSRVQTIMVQLPAHNTPQFEWIKSRLERCAQPVPPIFQPELAADAVLYAAAHAERGEIIVGWPALKAVLAAKLVPHKLIDRMLTKQGYEGQQMDQPDDEARPFNLFEPVPGEYSAHGRFDAMSKSGSWLFVLNKHRAYAVLSTLVVLTLLFAFIYRVI